MKKASPTGGKQGHLVGLGSAGSRVMKAVAWLLLLAQSALIVASRKHYSVDIVVAWYAVPLVFYFVDHCLGDMVGQGEPLDPRDRTSGSASAPLLPIKADHKEGRSKALSSPASAPAHEHGVWMNMGTLTGMGRPQLSDYEHRQRVSPATGKHTDDMNPTTDGSE